MQKRSRPLVSVAVVVALGGAALALESCVNTGSGPGDGSGGSNGSGAGGSAAGTGGGALTGTGGGAAGTGGRGSGGGTVTGTGGTAGRSGAGGAGMGGRAGTGGRGAGGSINCPSVMDAPTTVCTGAQPLSANPFGCSFAWGRQSPSGTGSLSSYNYLQIVANWVEPGVRSDGTYPTCSGCNWLTSRVASSNLVPLYYAYFIGYYGHSNGLADANNNPSGGPTLLTGGAALIKSNRSRVIDMYARYAQQTYAVWSSKPLIWLLEGDFHQYSEVNQSSPLTGDELGQLAADITCAIKTNMPNAVVAINHSTWNSNEETNCFWKGMRRAYYDLVWTTGVGDNGNFIEAAGAPNYYNAATATYPYIHALTGRNIVVDTSYGISRMSDSWSNQTAAVLNNHIANGVIGVNIASSPPADYQGVVTSLGPQLSSTCP